MKVDVIEGIERIDGFDKIDSIESFDSFDSLESKERQTMKPSLILLLPPAAVLLSPVQANGQTTIDPAHPYAWGANIGWVNTRPSEPDGAVIGQALCAGYLWIANCGWINLGSGSPVNGWQYANNSVTDWGVNRDGEGGLAGYAYGANVGWIVFEQTSGQPRVDLRTGDLAGYAWGANVGWISLSNTMAHVRTTRLDVGPDMDADGIPDTFEWRRAGNLAALQGGTHDADADGQSDADEDVSDLLAITAFLRGSAEDSLTWRSRPTRLYRIEASLSLLPARWANAADGLIGPPAGASTTQDVVTTEDAKRFYRVRAIVPLSE
jgi:hypothetical protein